MRAVARRSKGSAEHELEIRGLYFSAWERKGGGEADVEPTPEELLAGSLAACTAKTMQTYAERKGWDLGDVAVEVDYEPAQRGSPARCDTLVRLPADLSEEQRERLMQVAMKSPVHRTLEGEIIFDDRLALSRPHSASPASTRSRSRRPEHKDRRKTPASRGKLRPGSWRLLQTLGRRTRA